jgi:hypothetical protein
MPLPKSRKKLLSLFSEIKNESLQRIISEVISVENEYRSSSSSNFPRRKIEDVIDAEANLVELKRREGEKKK